MSHNASLRMGQSVSVLAKVDIRTQQPISISLSFLPEQRQRGAKQPRLTIDFWGGDDGSTVTFLSSIPIIQHTLSRHKKVHRIVGWIKSLDSDLTSSGVP